MKENDINKIIESWDDWEKVPASPFFASRTLAKWENQQEDSPFSVKNVWRPSLLIAFTILNLFWLFGVIPNSSSSSNKGEGVTSLQQEYFDSNTSADEINLYSL